MADIAAADVTYTELAGSAKASPADPRRSAICTIAFGDGALTYPSGGVPLTKGKLGCPTQIDELIVMDAGTGAYMIRYDATNGKLRLFNSLTVHTHDLLLKNAAVADGATAHVNAGANLLGANTGSDLTITGAGANGGVKNSAVAGATELANVAVTAVTIKVKVVGY